MTDIIESAIVRRLLEEPAVADLISDRIDEGRPAQGSKLPAVAYFEVFHQSGQTTGSSRSARRMGPEMKSLQFNCFARTVLEAEAVRDAVRGLLQGFAGGLGAFYVKGIFWVNGGSIDPDPDQKPSSIVFGRWAQFDVHYRFA